VFLNHVCPKLRQHSVRNIALALTVDVDRVPTNHQSGLPTSISLTSMHHGSRPAFS